MSRRNNQVDLNELKTFYDPHLGPVGDFLPIPTAVKKVAEELNGKTMTLGEALAKLRAVTTGKVELDKRSDCIILSIAMDDWISYYRVIRYRQP